MVTTSSSVSLPCGLCGTVAKLQRSHIIPKFVGDWLKETSATGGLRNPANPNLRKQDLAKQELLCSACEGRFSRWETEFAQRIFKPYQEQAATGQFEQAFAYEEWLLRFAVSLSWRVAAADVASFREDQPELARFVDTALLTWRKYLLKDNISVGAFHHHLLFFPEVKSTQRSLPEGFHAYVQRSVDATLVTDDQSFVHVFTKLPNMVFLSAIQPVEIPKWSGTRIGQCGRIPLAQSVKGGFPVANFLVQRAEYVAGTMAGMSARQQGRIIANMQRDAQRTAQSLTMRAIIADQKWSGK